MSQVTKIFRRSIPQLLHMLVLPIFFFAFMLIYRPFASTAFLGNEWYSVHLTIISCILFLSLILSRLLFYFLPMKINYSLYIVWCVSEVIFTSFFAALYIWLVLHKPLPYFEVFAKSFQYLFLSLIYPYSLLGVSMRLYEYSHQPEDLSTGSHQRMRFYDERHVLKIVLTSESIYYITSEENYVNIFYVENGKVRKYVLRSSMKALDELCQDHGLIRCHRSYYVNPVHVRTLRKEKDGIIYAELDAGIEMHIPVTKTYYDRLSELL